MSRRVATEELDLIEQIIADHPKGLSISALETELTLHRPSLNRRTLQRRLKELLEKGRIATEGESIALVYKPAPASARRGGAKKQLVGQTIDEESVIPFSSEGARIRDVVRQPLPSRKPIGYSRSFLEGYEPGVNFYLAESLRDQLHSIGRTPDGPRPAGTYAREILGRLLIDLSWSSSRLEGNTYSRLDTQNLIELGQAAEGKDLLETQMILNHKAAIEMLIMEVDQVGFNLFTFLNLHAILAENLLADDACGRLRLRPVEISGSTYLPLAMPQVIEDYFRLLLEKAAAIPDPFEQSFFLMVQLPYLQPFEDVNKRVSRLGANIPLIRHNLCPLSFVDVPEQEYIDGLLGVYENNRVELLRDVFVWAYERSCQRYLAIAKSMVEPDPLRIRYREELIQVVQAIIRNSLLPSPENIRNLSAGLVEESGRQVFCDMALEALKRLHEGRVARYRLKLSEFQAWKRLLEG